jgi:hypothetical protein
VVLRNKIGKGKKIKWSNESRVNVHVGKEGCKILPVDQHWVSLVLAICLFICCHFTPCVFGTKKINSRLDYDDRMITIKNISSSDLEFCFST